jgi:hypothetical protein
MPGPNVGKATLVRTVPSYSGCHLPKLSGQTAKIALGPRPRDCSGGALNTLAPVGGVGSILLFRGGSK